MTTTHRFRRNLWLPAGWYSSFIGWSARRSVPRLLRGPLYGAFSRMVGADLEEVEHALDTYPTFGEFFARGLRAGARAFTLAPDEIASPCDGMLAISGPVERGTLIQAKGHEYQLGELLADDALAARLTSGADGGAAPWFATIYLSPADYHRVHAPVAGRIVAYEYIPGELWPVKPYFTRTVRGLFARNERAIIHLETSVGPVAVVLVAAVGVGHLRIGAGDLGEAAAAGKRRERRRVELARPIEVARGEEIGAFLLGSTVVMVLPPAAAVEPAPIEPGAAVRCGQSLGRIQRPGVPGGRRGGQA